MNLDNLNLTKINTAVTLLTPEFDPLKTRVDIRDTLFVEPLRGKEHKNQIDDLKPMSDVLHGVSFSDPYIFRAAKLLYESKELKDWELFHAGATRRYDAHYSYEANYSTQGTHYGSNGFCLAHKDSAWSQIVVTKGSHLAYSNLPYTMSAFGHEFRASTADLAVKRLLKVIRKANKSIQDLIIHPAYVMRGTRDRYSNSASKPTNDAFRQFTNELDTLIPVGWSRDARKVFETLLDIRNLKHAALEHMDRVERLYDEYVEIRDNAFSNFATVLTLRDSVSVLYDRGKDRNNPEYWGLTIPNDKVSEDMKRSIYTLMQLDDDGYVDGVGMKVNDYVYHISI